MAKKMATIVNAAPCGGKTTIKGKLGGFNVTCVDMSEAIKWAAAKNRKLKLLADKLSAAHKLLPCDVVVDIFTDYIETYGCGKVVVFGAPRTKEQAQKIADHQFFEDFDNLRVIDVAIELSTIESRFHKRQQEENRIDDKVEWSVFKENRVKPFVDERYKILSVFNAHDRWRVGCTSGDGDNSATSIAERIVKSMNLRKIS
jgi:adenylate kinase family enzyme